MKREIQVFPHGKSMTALTVEQGDMETMVRAVAKQSNVYAVHILVQGVHVGPPSAENRKLVPPSWADIKMIHDTSADHLRCPGDPEKSWCLELFK